MWVATADLPKSAGHPFYAQLNRVLDDAGFDTFVEAQCAQFYADGIGRPSLAPGRYFRLLLLGYFEGLDSERAIAWRAADSLSIRQFLDFALHEAPPDHSTLSRTRRLIDVETHQAVFTWVLQRLADAHLVEGHTIGIDATTLEANAAMRSIVRRDTGEAYEAWLTRLAEASGIATPTRAELARFDRKRKKKGSNEDWTHPHDPDAKITKMKDGRTHLAHTAEHAVDLETGAIVGVTVQDADAGDTTTMVDTLIEAADQVAAVDGASGIAEVVGDKGYHSNETMVGFADLGVRSYVSEPDRGRRKWKGKAAAKKAVYANRRRIRGNRGQRLLRQRGERVERPNAHLYETGGMRRVHLRGHPNILKRLLVHVCGFNLGLLMRQLTGVGTPRSLQGRAAALLGALIDLLGGLCERLKRSWAPGGPRCAGFVVGETGDRSIRTHDPRFTKSPFCHGLLVAPRGPGSRAISEFPKWRKYLILLSFLDNSSARPVQIGGVDVNICHSRSTAVRGRRRSSSQSPPRGPFCRTRTGPVEADGAVDAQNAPTAPWKTLCVFHELPQGLSHQVTHEKLRKAPKYRWETRIDPDLVGAERGVQVAPCRPHRGAR